MSSTNCLGRATCLSVLLAGMILLVACTEKGATGENQTAKLVITTTVYDGNNKLHYEFTRDGKTASADVEYKYNPPTGDESFVGDLSPIFEAIAGKAPEDPSLYQTKDSILAVLAERGWRIVDETAEEMPSEGGPAKFIRTIHLERETD